MSDNEKNDLVNDALNKLNEIYGKKIKHNTDSISAVVKKIEDLYNEAAEAQQNQAPIAQQKDQDTNVDDLINEEKKQILQQREVNHAEEVEDVDVTEYFDDNVLSGLSEQDLAKVSDAIKGALQRMARAKASNKLLTKKVKRVPLINDAAQIAATVGMPGLARELTVEHPKPIITDLKKVGNAKYRLYEEVKNNRLEPIHTTPSVKELLIQNIGEINLQIIKTELDYKENIETLNKNLEKLKDELKTELVNEKNKLNTNASNMESLKSEFAAAFAQNKLY